MFTLRIGMYTGKENKDTVSSFLHGYEIGRNNECNFIEQIMKSIEEEYEIKSRATGWIGQIEMVAEKLEMDWIIIFKKQSLKFLTSKFTEPIKIEFGISIKSRINGKMLGVENHFRRDWITDWFGIVDLKSDWFKELWSSKELKLMKKIEEELLSLGKVREIQKQIKPTNKLRNLCAKMYEEMNKNS
jgi:hypothetical protein